MRIRRRLLLAAPLAFGATTGCMSFDALFGPCPAGATDCSPSTAVGSGGAAGSGGLSASGSSASSGSGANGTCPPTTNGATDWVLTFGDAQGYQRAEAVGIDDTGTIVVSGDFAGTIDLGGVPLTADAATPDKTDIFVTQRDAMGNHIWSHNYGPSSIGTATGLAVLPSGEYAISGLISSNIVFGGSTSLQPDAGTDGYVAQFSSTNAFVFDNIANCPVLSATPSVAANATRTVIAGRTYGDITIDGQTFPKEIADAGTSDTDVLVASFVPPDGHLEWAALFGGGGNFQQAHAVSLTGTGEVIVGGEFQKTIDFRVGTAPSVPTNPVGFVMKLDAATGAPKWGEPVGIPGTAIVRGVYGDADGGSLITGHFADTINVGGAALTASDSDDAFVVALDKDGKTKWNAVFGGPLFQSGVRVTRDRAGNVIVIGSFDDSIQIGGDMHTSNGGSDVFVAKLDPTGNVLWSRTFGGLGNEAGTGDGGLGLATAPDCGIVISGAFDQTVDFGKGDVTSQGGSDMFVVRLGP